MLELKNIICGYRKDNPVLKGVNLHIRQNEAVAIIGQNGAGKSTLTKTILNMVPYISGNILFEGNSIVGKTTQDIVKKGIGYFFQGGRVFPHLTVEENITFAGSGLNKKEFERRNRELEQYFDLLNKGNKNRLKLQASYLSGGEQHQLALAMVLMRKPKFLILDEPSAGLSPGNVRKLYYVLTKIKKEMNLGFLLIEQNVNIALEFGNEVFLLKNGFIEQQTIDLESVEEKYFN